jgi:hypothetical protein
MFGLSISQVARRASAGLHATAASRQTLRLACSLAEPQSQDLSLDFAPKPRFRGRAILI